MFINFCIARPKYCFILYTPAVWQLWLNEYVTLCYVTQITVPCIYDLAAFGGGAHRALTQHDEVALLLRMLHVARSVCLFMLGTRTSSATTDEPIKMPFSGKRTREPKEPRVRWRSRSELSMGWADPRVGLGWVGLGWVHYSKSTKTLEGLCYRI